MGMGFVILAHLIGIFILSVILAVIAGIVTYLSAKEKRIRKVVFAMLTPFIGLYTFYFAFLFSSATVSEYKGVDIGIGDAWYVPLSDSSQLLFIDLPEQAFIEYNGFTVISDVEEIKQIDTIVYAKTWENKYFVFNTINGETRELGDANEFYKHHQVELMKATDFYDNRKDEILGWWITVALIVSVLASALAIYLARLIIMRIFQ